MGAGIFLNVVVIGAGILMLCVAGAIIYNKYGDIVDEYREWMTRRECDGTPIQEDAKMDVEVGQVSTHLQPPSPATCEVPTMESPSSVSDGGEDDQEGPMDEYKHIHQFYGKDSRVLDYNYAAKNSQESYQLPAKDTREIDVDSYAGSSCYMDASYIRPKTSPSFSPSDGPTIAITTSGMHAASNQRNEISFMDYSVDSSMIDNKEPFSAFARPKQTNFMGVDVTINGTEDAEHESSCSSLGKHNSVGITDAHHLDDISVETSDIPVSVEVSTAEDSDQFSMVKPNTLTFTSQSTSDATSTHCNGARATTAYSLRPHKRSLSSKQDETMVSEPEDSAEKPKPVTPHTASTAGLWSPTSDTEPAERNDTGRHNDFSASEKSDNDQETLQTIQREAKNECFAPFYASHSVHVCRSAFCNSCRNPKFNSPIFLNAKKTSTGQDYNLARSLPKRWWETQKEDVQKLKQYVSDTLLSRQQQIQQIDSSMEDHPFDED